MPARIPDEELKNELVRLSSKLGRNPTGEDMDKFGEYHITPIRDFESWKDANYKENLISLCRPCHLKVEKRDEKIEIW